MNRLGFTCLKRLRGGFPQGLRFVLAAFSFFLLPSLEETWADTVSIYFPPALEASTGITTSTGGSLAGFTVRAGIFTSTPSQLLANLAGQTSAANIRSTIHASFTQYGSFSMTDALLNDPDQAVFTIEDPIAPALRGQDFYLLFYNDASFNNATEMGIFRMATRANVPGQGVGVFPTLDDGFGSRVSEFYFADQEKLVGAESFLNLLVGQYNATAGSFTLGALEGGIGQITSVLAKTNARGFPATYQIQANHGPDRYFATTNTSTNDLTVTTLPTGFSISTNTGVITVATNAAVGTNTIRLVASNSLTAVVATNTLTWVLKNPTLSFTNSTNQTLISITSGTTNTNSFISTGTNPTFSVAKGDLFGLSFDSDGTLKGAPNRTGEDFITINSFAGDEVGAFTFRLVVSSFGISVDSGFLEAGTLVATSGISKTVLITNTGGFTDLTGSISPVRDGVTFDGSSLIIATNAQPLAKGTANVTLTLTARRAVGDSTVSASTTVPLRIVAPSPSALIGTNEFEVDVGLALSTNILTDAGPYARMSFSNLPLGLIGSQNGTVAGTNISTSLPFEFPVTVIADSTFDYEGGGIFTSTVTFRLRNTNAPYFASATNRHYPGVGRAISPITLVASNFPFQYTASNLPAGLQLVGATISGTPTTAGRFEVPVVAYNAYRPGSTNPADWRTGSSTLIFHVANARPPANLAPTSPGALAHGVAIALTDNRHLLDAANNGVRVAAYGLPPGISLDAETGKIYGTPTSRGTFTATVFMQNGRGWIKRSVTLTVQ